MQGPGFGPQGKSDTKSYTPRYRNLLMEEWIRDLSIQAWAERKHYYQEIFTGDLEKELGTGTRLYIGNTQA